jgi:hypothetical protein
MPLLGPGIGEKNVKSRNGFLREHFFNNLNRIGFYYTDIVKPPFFNFPEEPPNSRPVYLDAQVVPRRVLLGDPGGGLPHAETNFNGDRTGITEQGGAVQNRGGGGDAITGGKFIVGPFLGGAYPAGTEDITPDPPAERGRGKRFRGRTPIRTI